MPEVLKEESIWLVMAELISARPRPIAPSSPSLPVGPILMEPEQTGLWAGGSKILKTAAPVLLQCLGRASGRRAQIEASFLPSKAVGDSSLGSTSMGCRGLTSGVEEEQSQLQMGKVETLSWAVQPSEFGLPERSASRSHLVSIILIQETTL